MVRATDTKVIEEVLEMDAAAWFGDDGEAFKSAHPELIYNDWEVVPGIDIVEEDVEVDEDVAGVLFCDLREDPPSPIRLERDGRIRLLISDEGCEVQGGKPSRSPTLIENLSASVGEFFDGALEEAKGLVGAGE